MWNDAYSLELKQHFDLRHFPFDRHGLQIEIRQDNSLTWDKYDLTVCAVQ